MVMNVHILAKELQLLDIFFLPCKTNPMVDVKKFRRFYNPYWSDDL